MSSSESIAPGDVAAGASALGLMAAVSVARRAGSVLAPAARFALRPPGVPSDLQPARLLGSVGRLGAEGRAFLAAEISRILDDLVPAVLAEVLRRARLTELVARYVDLDEVVAGVDLDAAVSRVDLDAILKRVEVDAVVSRVDVEAVLDRLDLTAVVLQRVDLGAIVDEVLAKLDLVALTEQVIDAVDLPEIIRESTGSMASETVRGARMQGIAADEAVGHAIDRLLLRRGRTATGPEVPEQSDRNR